MLSDVEILEMIDKGEITIDPFKKESLHANTYEFSLGNTILELRPRQTIDLKSDVKPVYDEVGIEDNGYVLKPKQFVLASTIERVSTSKRISVLIDGLSALARIGISIHQTSTHCKPGQPAFTPTLEIFNASETNIVLHKGMEIGKFLFISSEKENSEQYKSQYTSGDGKPKGAVFNP